MSLSKKDVREIAGFTFLEVGSDPEIWINRARAFKDAAELIAKNEEYSPPFPYYYNAGISLELYLKAIAITQGKTFEANHRLNDLCKLVGMKLNKDQYCTLELLSELIIWGGRYPVPKKEGQWDNYHDVIQEKHKKREQEGNVGRVLANQDRFPSLKNCSILWALCEQEYASSINSKA